MDAHGTQINLYFIQTRSAIVDALHPVSKAIGDTWRHCSICE